MVDAHGMAGILATNAGDPTAAMRHLTLASSVASAAGDPILKGPGLGAPSAPPVLPARRRTRQRPPGGHPPGQGERAGPPRRRLYPRLAPRRLRRAGRRLRRPSVVRRPASTPPAVRLTPPPATMAGSSRLRGSLRCRAICGQCAPGSPVWPAGWTRPSGRSGRRWPRRSALANASTGCATSGRSASRTTSPWAPVRLLADALGDACAQGCAGKVARIRAVRLRMDPAHDTLDCVRSLDAQLTLAG